VAAVGPQDGGQRTEAAGAGMAHMAGHMYMTTLRPPQPGDQAKADAIVAAAKTALAPYNDYHKALADGYEIFLPNVPQPQYHFTRLDYGREAWRHFDPLKPTSLLYKKTADGYTLVGAMYTDRVDAKFGLLGSITTPEACEAAGGEFLPHLFGWMVHVYPYETDPKKIWATDDDDEGHDNMDHSAMPGMKMK
jgi:hypothetical protein